jgi:DNA replication protein DnaC
MTPDSLLQRIKALKLHGLLSHWDEISNETWVKQFIEWEETARIQRSLERRTSGAHIERFKSLADFDWKWPTQCDRPAIEGWMRLNFINDAINPILCGPNGIGKTMIACNVAHEALLRGYTVHFTTASDMLQGLARLDSDTLLRQRIKYYSHPALLIIDGMKKNQPSLPQQNHLSSGVTFFLMQPVLFLLLTDSCITQQLSI